MSQLFQGKTHRYQIDCSNHDQVINALQMKSKDLYYFWVLQSSQSATTNGSIINTTQILSNQPKLQSPKKITIITKEKSNLQNNKMIDCSDKIKSLRCKLRPYANSSQTNSHNISSSQLLSRNSPFRETKLTNMSRSMKKSWLKTKR